MTEKIFVYSLVKVHSIVEVHSVPFLQTRAPLPTYVQHVLDVEVVPGDPEATSHAGRPGVGDLHGFLDLQVAVRAKGGPHQFRILKCGAPGNMRRDRSKNEGRLTETNIVTETTATIGLRPRLPPFPPSFESIVTLSLPPLASLPASPPCPRSDGRSRSFSTLCFPP